MIFDDGIGTMLEFGMVPIGSLFYCLDTGDLPKIDSKVLVCTRTGEDTADAHDGLGEFFLDPDEIVQSCYD